MAPCATSTSLRFSLLAFNRRFPVFSSRCPRRVQTEVDDLHDVGDDEAMHVLVIVTKEVGDERASHLADERSDIAAFRSRVLLRVSESEREREKCRLRAAKASRCTPGRIAMAGRHSAPRMCRLGRSSLHCEVSWR